jgi:hypothetical protein
MYDELMIKPFDSAIKQTLRSIFVFLICLLPVSAFAGIHDGSGAAYNSRLIDHKLTPKAAIELCREASDLETKRPGAGIQALAPYEKHTIFWKGRVEKFITMPDSFRLRIKTAEGLELWAIAGRKVRNLDYDRTGFVIAIKGNLIFSRCRINYIKARSVILIEPSEEMSWQKFREPRFSKGWYVIKTQKTGDREQNPYFSFILHRIYMHNPDYSKEDIKKIAVGIIDYSEKYSVDPLLLTALLNIESAFDVDAVSSSGAIGLGQLMPFTARSLGVDPMDPAQNVGGAAKYFSTQLRRWKYSGDPAGLALASYNAGPGAVERYNGIPPYSETQNYVFFIKFLRNEYLKQIRSYK